MDSILKHSISSLGINTGLYTHLHMIVVMADPILIMQHELYIVSQCEAGLVIVLAKELEWHGHYLAGTEHQSPVSGMAALQVEQSLVRVGTCHTMMQKFGPAKSTLEDITLQVYI